MAVIHTNHVQAPIVRDHREAQGEFRRPVRVGPVRVQPVRVRYEQPIRYERPVIVRPVVYTPAPIYTSWTPAPSYTYQPQAMQVLAPTPLANDQLTIDTSLGNASTLELDAAGGSTFVSQVILYSANGASQVIPVNQMLSAQNPTIPLSFDNCNGVSRIVVDGHSDWGGALAIRAL